MSVRERILDVTAEIASSDGASFLTLDHVADRAGISKGGLLYHFSSKDELLRAVIEHEADKFDAAIEELLGRGTPLLEAYVEVACETHRNLACLAATFLAAAAVDRSLLTPLVPRCDAWRKRLEDHGVPCDAVRAAMLMGDGLLVGSALGLVSLSDAELAALKRNMLWLLRPRYELELLKTARLALTQTEA